jgi:hypothetical protein
LWASISFVHADSPLVTTQVSRNFFVSGQEQQIFFPDLPRTGAEAGGAVGAVVSVLDDDEFPMRSVRTMRVRAPRAGKSAVELCRHCMCEFAKRAEAPLGEYSCMVWTMATEESGIRVVESMLDAGIRPVGAGVERRVGDTAGLACVVLGTESTPVRIAVRWPVPSSVPSIESEGCLDDAPGVRLCITTTNMPKALGRIEPLVGRMEKHMLDDVAERERLARLHVITMDKVHRGKHVVRAKFSVPGTSLPVELHQFCLADASPLMSRLPMLDQWLDEKPRSVFAEELQEALALLVPAAVKRRREDCALGDWLGVLAFGSAPGDAARTLAGLLQDPPCRVIAPRENSAFPWAMTTDGAMVFCVAPGPPRPPAMVFLPAMGGVSAAESALTAGGLWSATSELKSKQAKPMQVRLFRAGGGAEDDELTFAGPRLALGFHQPGGVLASADDDACSLLGKCVLLLAVVGVVFWLLLSWNYDQVMAAAESGHV